MGCCGSSSSGPSHASFAAGGQIPAGGGHPVGNWKVTARDGSLIGWFANQIVAFAEAGVNGGSVQWDESGPDGTGTVG